MIDVGSDETTRLEDVQPWYRPGKWYTCAATWLPEVRKTMPRLPKKVYVQDVTLREAQTNISVSLSVDAKVELARKLGTLGIVSLDCGFAGNSQDETLVREIAFGKVVESAVKITLGFLCMDIAQQADDIKRACDHAVEIGCTGFVPVCFACPRDRTEIDLWVDVVQYIAETHPDLALGFGFIGTSGAMNYLLNRPGMRSSFDWQVELARLVTQAGVQTVNMADSNGIASPAAWKYIASQFRDAIGPEKGLMTHNHNDYGQALANALAAVEGGANWVDVALCGLGHRAGNSALEEVVMALEALYGIETGIQTEKLYEVCAFFQAVSGARAHPWKAIVGERLWAEAGAASAELLRLKWQGKDLFEAGMEVWNPKVVGLSHQIYIGKDSLTFFPSGAPNPAVAEGLLNRLGLRTDTVSVERVMKAILFEIERREAAGEDKWLTEEEVAALCLGLVERETGGVGCRESAR